jgi:hypothetical protein
MIGTTRKAVVLSMSAALILSGPIGAFAAPANGSAPKYISQAAESAENGVILVRKGRGGSSWKGSRGGRSFGNRGRSFGSFKNRGRSYGSFKNRGRSYGSFKHRGRRNNHGLYYAPFLAAPFFYGGYYGYDPYYDYGYSGYDSDCYSECREDHSRSYCRRYWHRYC